MEVQTLLQILHLQHQLLNASSLACHAMPVVPKMKTKQFYKTIMNDTNDVSVITLTNVIGIPITQVH
jgi:hypothetical protein